MAMSGKILDLRNLLAIRFPQAPMLVGTRLVTGLASFDQLIGGGLPKGAITELISPRGSAGSASLVHENSWNLETLEKQEAISQLRIVVKRSHLKSVVPPSVAAATYGGASNGQ